MSGVHPLIHSVVSNDDGDWGRFQQIICHRLVEGDLHSDAAQNVSSFLNTKGLMEDPVDERWATQYEALFSAVQQAFAITMPMHAFPCTEDACRILVNKPQEGWKAAISSEQRATLSEDFPRLFQLFDYFCDCLHPHMQALINRSVEDSDVRDDQLTQLMRTVIEAMPMISRDSSYLDDATDIPSQATPPVAHANDDADSFDDSSDSFSDDAVTTEPGGRFVVGSNYGHVQLPNDESEGNHASRLPPAQRHAVAVSGQSSLDTSREDLQDVRGLAPPISTITVVPSLPESVSVDRPEVVGVPDPAGSSRTSCYTSRPLALTSSMAAEDMRSVDAVAQAQSTSHTTSRVVDDMSMTGVILPHSQAHSTSHLTSGSAEDMLSTSRLRPRSRPHPILNLNLTSRTMEDMSMTGVVSPSHVRGALSSTTTEAAQRPTAAVAPDSQMSPSVSSSRSLSRSPSRASARRPITPHAETPHEAVHGLSKSDATKAPSRRFVSSTPIAKLGERKVSDGSASQTSSSGLESMPSGFTIAPTSPQESGRSGSPRGSERSGSPVASEKAARNSKLAALELQLKLKDAKISMQAQLLDTLKREHDKMIGILDAHLAYVKKEREEDAKRYAAAREEDAKRYAAERERHEAERKLDAERYEAERKLDAERYAAERERYEAERKLDAERYDRQAQRHSEEMMELVKLLTGRTSTS